MATPAALRRLLLGTLLIGLTGTAIELLLLKHHEGPIQLVPLVSIALGLTTIGWHLVWRSRASVRAVQGVMVLFLVSGAAGIVFHFRANLQYQREFDATLHGRALVWQALRAKVPPALAPGVMVQLGLIGLAYTCCRRSGPT
jgi:hypothetical protein